MYGKESSHPCHSHQAQSSDSSSHRQPHYDSRPVSAFRTRIDTPCVCGYWGHSVENCQQMAMYFLIVKYLQKDANMTSASQISEFWRLANKQHSLSARSTVRAIRDVMP
jgi:hypothetical protein